MEKLNLINELRAEYFNHEEKIFFTSIVPYAIKRININSKTIKNKKDFIDFTGDAIVKIIKEIGLDKILIHNYKKHFELLEKLNEEDIMLLLFLSKAYNNVKTYCKLISYKDEYFNKAFETFEKKDMNEALEYILNTDEQYEDFTKNETKLFLIYIYLLYYTSTKIKGIFMDYVINKKRCNSYNPIVLAVSTILEKHLSIIKLR